MTNVSYKIVCSGSAGECICYMAHAVLDPQRRKFGACFSLQLPHTGPTASCRKKC